MRKFKINYLYINSNNCTSYNSAIFKDVDSFQIDIFKETILPQAKSSTTLLNSHELKSRLFRNNLMMVDFKMPELLDGAMLSAYNKTLTLSGLCEKLNTENPLNFNQDNGQPFYELKLKRLLLALAQGLRTNKIWHDLFNGAEFHAVFRQLPKGVTHHFLTLEQFGDYLFANTVIDVSSAPSFQIRFA